MTGKKYGFELRKEEVPLKDGVVIEGSQFVYARNSTEILNLTVSTIYAGADGVLVRFSPVYQYLDPKVPMSQTPNGFLPNYSDNGFSGWFRGFKNSSGRFKCASTPPGSGGCTSAYLFFCRKTEKMMDSLYWQQSLFHF